MAYRADLKNFFYDITISSPDDKKSVRLSDTLMKMCNKADIVETVASDKDGAGASSLSLTFIEADFLPDNSDKTPITDAKGRGFITNRTGALIDLRFDGEKGFTYVTRGELESGLTQSSRTKSGTSESVSFLFATNNVIEITWGQLEPRSSRSLKFKIGTVTYSTGPSGNTLTLQAFTLQKELARIKVDEGKTWVDKTGKPQSLKAILYSIAYVFGARLEFDEQMITERPTGSGGVYVLDRSAVGGDTKVSTDGTPEYLLRSQSIDYWLKSLAEKFNSAYEIYEDPFVKIPVIKFTANILRYKKVAQTLNYRDPRGIMLDFQFNTIEGEIGKESIASALDETGKADSKYRTVAMTDGTQKPKNSVFGGHKASPKPRTFDNIPLVYNTRSRTELQRALVGTSLTVPSTTKSAVDNAANNATINKSFMGFITVKVVGHPDFQPDVYDIQGVGVRASTTYRFFQVEHSLSSSGYTCSMQGKTQESVDQGQINDEVLKENSLYKIVPLTTPKGS
jgi:hypothetical protein